MEQIKEKKKSKAVKTVIAVVLALAIIVAIGIGIINYLVRPVSDTDENAVYVGGMLTSDTIDYHYESADGLNSNLIMKIMQLVWKSCSASDAKKHEGQTPPTVEMIKDIPYIDDGNLYHRLDVFYPEGTTEALPVVIDIHGGGWMYATKDLNEYYCRAIADRGYIVFSISYRLVPDVTVNEQIQDCAAALKWINNNMGNYPCQAENVLLTGDSAGGMLSIYSAILLQNPELREIFEVEDAGIDISALLLTSPVPSMNTKGFMSMYSRLLWGKDYKDKATYNYMNLDQIIDYADSLPPTYLITSSGDGLANGPTHSTFDLLKEKGCEVSLVDYPEFNGKKLPHVFSVLEPFDEIGEKTIDDAMAFYQTVITNK